MGSASSLNRTFFIFRRNPPARPDPQKIMPEFTMKFLIFQASAPILSAPIPPAADGRPSPQAAGHL